MADQTSVGVTIEQLLTDKRCEVVDGTFIEVTMSPGYLHSIIIHNLYDLLKPVVKRHKLGRVFTDGLTYVLDVDEVGVRSARIPDVSFIRQRDLKQDFDPTRPYPGVPNLAVAVVSPSETTAQVMAKVADYLRLGSEQVWIIYPPTQELLQYFNDERPPRHYTADDTLNATPFFPELQFPIRDLFIDED